jgi:hypothetical protein
MNLSEIIDGLNNEQAQSVTLVKKKPRLWGFFMGIAL